MSVYSYAGPYSNPTEGWSVRLGSAVLEEAADEANHHEQPEPDLHRLREGIEIDPDKVYIVVPEEVRCLCGCYNCNKVLRTRYRLHTSHASGDWPGFDEEADAIDSIEATEEFFERDYEQYVEENHYEIAQIERYEMWRNEY